MESVKGAGEWMAAFDGAYQELKQQLAMAHKRLRMETIAGDPALAAEQAGALVSAMRGFAQEVGVRGRAAAEPCMDGVAERLRVTADGSV